MAGTKKDSGNYLDKLESEVKSNQSTVSMVLGALIILVLGVLLFNYINRDQDTGQTTETNTETNVTADVSPEDLPGKYTVKEGDTLFTIADHYYKDGFKYPEIAKANELDNENIISTGQVLEIPELEIAAASTAPETPEEPAASPVAEASPETSSEPAVGGGNTTVWGPNIEGDSYTVVEGDWLSTIAARAYGDILSYDKIAKANDIANPDVITPGMVLKLPR